MVAAESRTSSYRQKEWGRKLWLNKRGVIVPRNRSGTKRSGQKTARQCISVWGSAGIMTANTYPKSGARGNQQFFVCQRKLPFGEQTMKTNKIQKTSAFTLVEIMIVVA